jgi:hypothetical protein
MPVLSSENLTFSAAFGYVTSGGLCLRRARFGLFRLVAGLALDLLAKLFNPEQSYSRRSLGMVKVSVFIATMVVLSACDVPFIPGI